MGNSRSKSRKSKNKSYYHFDSVDVEDIKSIEQKYAILKRALENIKISKAKIQDSEHLSDFEKDKKMHILKLEEWHHQHIPYIMTIMINSWNNNKSTLHTNNVCYVPFASYYSESTTTILYPCNFIDCQYCSNETKNGVKQSMIDDLSTLFIKETLMPYFGTTPFKFDWNQPMEWNKKINKYIKVQGVTISIPNPIPDPDVK